MIGTTYTNSSDEALLVKTDANGNQLWNKSYAIGWGRAEVIEQTSDSGYILGGSKGANNGELSWLTKTDLEGNIEWNKTYGGIVGGPPFSIRQTLDGGYIIAGCRYQSAIEEDIWLMKTDNEGNIQWKTTYSQTFGYYCCVRQTVDGGYVLAASTPWTNASHGYALLVKIDPEGKTQWNRTYGISGENWATSVVQTSDGGYAIAVNVLPNASPSEVWLIKTDLNGSVQWSRTYGGALVGPEVFSIEKTDDGGYIMGASTEIIRTDSNGGVVWTKSFSDPTSRYGYDAYVAQQDLDGSYMIAGTRFDSQLGTYTLWLAEIAPFPPAASIVTYLVWSAAIPLGFIGFLALIETSRRKA